MEKGLKRVINIYHARCIYSNRVNTDNELYCIKNGILLIILEVITAEEHVGGVEGFIRTIKDGTRYDGQCLQHTHYPKMMIKGSIIKRVKDLNQLPLHTGISAILSLSTLITGKPYSNFS